MTHDDQPPSSPIPDERRTESVPGGDPALPASDTPRQRWADDLEADQLDRAAGHEALEDDETSPEAILRRTLEEENDI